jgi:predicted metal-dependent hydrolase
MMAPPAVLDYLAVHELAHLAESNHSMKYWLIVRSHCPDFQRHKKWLRENEWRLRHPFDSDHNSACLRRDGTPLDYNE